MKKLICGVVMLTFLMVVSVVAEAKEHLAKPESTFPTRARIEYVLQCMEANGKSPEMLDRCSCGIDVIALMIPYDTYETADTGLQMTNVPGNRAAAMRQTTTVIDAIDKLRKAQAESNLRCF
jgi:hypothetical protein